MEASADTPVAQTFGLDPETLTVGNLKQALHLYGEILGTPTGPTLDGWAAVGPAVHPLDDLREEPQAKARAAHMTGLCHVALLLPTRADPARVLSHLIETGYPLEGAADRGGSEAIYLSDPLVNEMEIFRGRAPIGHMRMARLTR